MNQTMMEMREQVFAEYREAIAKHDEVENRCLDLQKELQILHDQRSQAYEDTQRLKTLIEIMITEDCDPVMAKLRYEDRIREDMKTNLMGETSYDNVLYNPRYPNTVRDIRPNLLQRVMGAFNGR